MKWSILVLLVNLISCQTSSIKEGQTSLNAYSSQTDAMNREMTQLLSETISQMNGIENRVLVCMKLSRISYLAAQLASKGVAVNSKSFKSSAIEEYWLYKSNLNPALTSLSMLRAKNQLILWRQNYQSVTN